MDFENDEHISNLFLNTKHYKTNICEKALKVNKPISTPNRKHCHSETSDTLLFHELDNSKLHKT